MWIEIQEEYRKEFAVVFQEVFVFSFPLADNVSCRAEEDTSCGKLEQSLNRAVGDCRGNGHDRCTLFQPSYRRRLSFGSGSAACGIRAPAVPGAGRNDCRQDQGLCRHGEEHEKVSAGSYGNGNETDLPVVAGYDESAGG